MNKKDSGRASNFLFSNVLLEKSKLSARLVRHGIAFLSKVYVSNDV